jgi:hypothetical protein
MVSGRGSTLSRIVWISAGGQRQLKIIDVALTVRDFLTNPRDWAALHGE